MGAAAQMLEAAHEAQGLRAVAQREPPVRMAALVVDQFEHADAAVLAVLQAMRTVEAVFAPPPIRHVEPQSRRCQHQLAAGKPQAFIQVNRKPGQNVLIA